MKQSLCLRVVLGTVAVVFFSPQSHAQSYQCEATVSTTGAVFRVAALEGPVCDKFPFLADVSTDPKLGKVNWLPCDGGSGRISLELMDASGSFKTSLRLWDVFQQKLLAESTVLGDTMMPWNVSQRLTARNDFGGTVMIAVDCRR